MGVDVFFSASFTFVAVSFFSVSSGLAALPTTGAIVDDAAVGTGAKGLGVGVDVFSSTSTRSVVTSSSMGLGLVAPPTTGALVDDAAALSVGLNR